jgi:putative tricarboxylic transport membrane protein
MSMFAGKSRLGIAAVGWVVAALYFAAARQLRIPAFSDPIGPRTVPYLIAAGLCLAGLALVFEHFAMSRRGRSASQSAETGDGLTGVALFAGVLLAGYYLVFERLGFVVATALFLILFLSFANRGRWLVNIAVALVFPIAAYLLLDTLFGARLPAGLLRVG